VQAVLWNDTVTGDLGQHHTQSEDVGRLVESTAECLGRKVVAITFTIDMLGSWPRAGQTKVGDLETTLEIDEDVRRLQVEVDIPRVMDEGEALS
jgi:hypothetical protein